MGEGDRDMDGLLDSADNCPQVGNADQANEDGDPLGDACDRCPHLSDDAADRDGDGIGDACDPDPATNADTLWLFEGFRLGLPAWPGSIRWAPVGDGDQLRVTAPGGINDNAEYLVFPLTSVGRTVFDNFSVTIAIVIEQTVGNDFPEIGLGVYDENADRSVHCTLFQIGGQASARHFGVSDDIDLNNTQSFAWQTGAAYTVTVMRRGSSYSCNLTGPGGPLSRAGTSPLVPRSGAAIEIWAFGVTARLDWVHIVGP